MLKKIKSAFLFSLSLIFITSDSVFAVSESTLDFYDQNGIYYYNPEGGACNTSSSVGSFDGEASAGLTSLQAGFVDQYHDIAEQLSIEYGIPWETVMAQGIVESASGTSNFARERNNFFGIGAFDSNPDAAKSYPTPEEGWKGYYENIKNTSTYRAHDAFKYPGDPIKYLEAIKAAGYATDPNYIQKITVYIKAIQNRAQEKGWQTSDQLVASHPEMVENANRNQQGKGGESSSSYSTQNCVSAGNGDINSTAITLSWPDRSHAPTDPKKEYADALAATGVNKLGDTCSMGGYSCDAFVATVLRYSGADENVPCCGASRMLDYFASHPDLYQEIENIGNPSNMQPGDIRSKPSHVEMYIQLEDGSGRIASASHCDRTGDHADPYYPDSAYRIFRRIK